MIFSPSLAATPAATSVPREPISLVIAITVMADSCSRWCGRHDRDHQLLGLLPIGFAGRAM
jgi:hypothetical protein